LTGDIWGFKSDTTQITGPFVFTVNCIFENLKSQLHTKCNFVLQQKAAGSLAPSFIRKQEEYLWATGEIERGTPFIRIMPLFWHISPDEATAGETAARAKRIWESKGFSTQEDRGILNILLISALPFGLYNTQKNVEFIERDFIVHSPAAVRFLPIQADFSGVANPVDLYIGRKGQIATLDIFDESAINHNCMISANSGSGKSFLMNYLLFNYYSTSGLIRIIDIGGSYKKLCRLVGGKYISFTRDSGIVLNPFSNIIDINEDQNILAAIICQMVYSSTSEKATETQMTLIKQAVRYTYQTHGNKGQIDHVYEYLSSFEKHVCACSGTEDIQTINGAGKLTEIALDLAFNLQDFTSSGVYGKWFAGDSNLNISKDDFVVLELEDLKPQVELFRVVILQLINYITNNLYLSTREQKRIIVFDESWQFLGQDGSDSTEASMMEQVIEGGYRRARKYNGAFITIFQSLLDLKKFGGVGNVIKANSAFKFLLESTDYAVANNEKIIDYNQFILEILKSVKTPKPRYSEIFMETPVGSGVARLLVTPYNYWMFTSDAKDNAKIEALVNQGMSYADAFETLASA
jgi:conjugal transfer ATP-binding protein TraC